MKKFIYLTVLILVCSSVSFAQRETRDLELSANGIKELEIEAGAGFLKIRGVEGLKKIEVEAEIVVKGIRKKDIDEFLEDNLELSLEREGKRVVLISTFHHSRRSRSFFGRRKSALINIIVRIPYEMNLVIEDGSGYTEIENLKGNINIHDGSGSLTIEKIIGDVDVNDGSGRLEIRDIEGDVEIDDNSGSILVRDILGSVYVEDGSGSITINGVERNVVIGDDGSGGVSIRNVKGKVERHDKRRSRRHHR